MTPTAFQWCNVTEAATAATVINARMMRQAIHTQWLGPTNFRGSRVKAKADAGSITIGWDHALNIDQNHAAAAVALADKLGWNHRWVGGSIHGSGYVFVALEDE